ncbi:hypothetical protein DFH08DRAFT_815445 [Mycena albidolilacea]|uniref:Uncharacterized protein n=1 Tax=Mycena albidolilacea TaxID=1033008 RepID=A0AAD6ZNV2_9AGAR|nr:hypothetical protein DFH08DRAFT_815445 [Mycena albidolilacea]
MHFLIVDYQSGRFVLINCGVAAACEGWLLRAAANGSFADPHPIGRSTAASSCSGAGIAFGVSQKPSGILMGYTEGITYVSTKGDARYIISNGKDQKLRLWGLHKMRSNQDLEEVENNYYGTNYNYRYPHYPKPRLSKMGGFLEDWVERQVQEGSPR